MLAVIVAAARASRGGIVGNVGAQIALEPVRPSLHFTAFHCSLTLGFVLVINFDSVGLNIG